MESKGNQIIGTLQSRLSELKKENADMHIVAQELQTILNKATKPSKSKTSKHNSHKHPGVDAEEFCDLLYKLPFGFVLQEIICDNSNTPVNYRYLAANPAFEKISGLKSDQILGRTILDVLPDLEPEWLDLFGRVALTGEASKFESYTNLFERYYEVLAFSPAKNRFALLFNDITERRILEKKLLETMVEAEEKEREKFASNLHDEVGPILSSLNLYISTLAESDDKNKKTYIIPQMQSLIREALTTIRDISNDLSPHVLLNNNLEKAIKAHIELCKDLLPVIFRSNIKEKRFQHNIELVFYRIVKELLNNTIKHANAKSVSIQLSFDGNLLKMKYSDNGIGFNPDAILQSSTGMGLVNIFSRAKTINAQYLINTKPGAGFSFEIWTNAG